MKPYIVNFLIILVFLILFVLDWAALHDIIKGKEDLKLEWAMISFSIVVLFLLITFRFKYLRKR